MSLKPYAEYKDSGQQWLGEIPAEWRLSPVKHVARLLAGGTPESSNDQYWTEAGGTSWVAIGDMSGRDMVVSTTRQVTAEGMATKTLPIAPPGTVLFAMYASVGEVSILGIHAAWNQALLGFRVNGDRADSKFLFYALKSVHGWLPVFYRSNTQNNLNAEQVGNLVLPMPEKAEQQAIASYLERETAKIDAFIADQEELIKLLEERRTATITQAVTKGLDPKALMKDSGVEWVGDVPAHWPISKIGHQYEVVLGKMLDGAKDTPSGARMLPYVRAGNIQDAGLDLSDVNEMAYTAYEAERLNLLAKDLLVVEGGSVGTVHYLSEAMDGWSFQKTVNRVRSLGSADTQYLGHLIRVFRDSGVFEVICNGSTIMHLTAEKLRALMIPVPPVEEQYSIAAFIDRETAEIDATLAEAREAIALSKERRAAVISAAVTGKIDVRGTNASATKNMEAESVGVA